MPSGFFIRRRQDAHAKRENGIHIFPEIEIIIPEFVTDCLSMGFTFA